ncbi:hypothetical protein GCM10011390_08300 [Aureimonas endophytica]|uniref:Uncharacterized protein n=1 Tax=Aureimonas endophytica TaxID=2027858 RepID=A0A917E1G4_9HYPH|nr:hypothetical protein [Aureimonas endophytica]GGD91901.1 hypothetical protein GCM10011390_08300 [Aureimonas endophytica]
MGRMIGPYGKKSSYDDLYGKAYRIDDLKIGERRNIISLVVELEKIEAGADKRGGTPGRTKARVLEALHALLRLSDSAEAEEIAERLRTNFVPAFAPVQDGRVVVWRRTSFAF